ncbi:uncharacterized protein LOC100893922 isoform X2 [Strongylocentrotus purpuratus]|uniref:RING-type domain-containing protein n=1 Tax=Strongylocentrotus purpuratus TaxID=7668 RepID=A0A7M7N7M6_STRPU|nr:uncharacterized protein LOC100893922 isoform X2 [Strongylocentrotus purpuratus]|eukprot:XP_003728193.1 PREDICTED: uncharacterized protein LOC100893922 isoform X2 [Strongylocentrotus purpuratus]
MDTNDDLHLSIPLDPLKESFSCPICMCLYHMTTLTQCGHRYCEGCILEWIDRKRRCPCCNAPVRIAELIRDTGFDALIQIVVRQKNKAEDAYFSDLIKKCNEPSDKFEPMVSDEPSDKADPTACDEPSSTSTEVGTSDEKDKKPAKDEDLSPVERILQKHIRVGIVEHERYYRNLKGRFQKHFDHALKQIDDLKEKDDEESQAERKTWIQKKRILAAEFHKCTKLLATTYDKYLTQHLPTLSTLPVTVFFRLFGKDIVVGELVLQPHMSMSQIKEMLFLRIKEKQDRVAVYRDSNIHYLLIRPYSKGDIVADESLVFTLLAQDNPYSTDQNELMTLIPSDSIPVLEYGIQPGCDIIIFGEVKLRSELPRPCFKALFEEGEDKMDYFTCKDCSFNWVCRSCRDHCHKDHETIPYVMGHQPTWACCYCPRKKKCLLGTEAIENPEICSHSISASIILPGWQ